MKKTILESFFLHLSGVLGTGHSGQLDQNGEWAKAAEKSLGSHIPYIWVPTREAIIVRGTWPSDQFRVRPQSTVPFSEGVKAPRVAWPVRDSEGLGALG